MKNAIKNLFLPGTNKNVGYLNKSTMHIYKRYMGYLPWDASGHSKYLKDKTYQFILVLKDKKKKTEETMKVDYSGWNYNIDLKTFDFHNCTFKTPDNLDVIEMAYLYKNWSKKKNG